MKQNIKIEIERPLKELIIEVLQRIPVKLLSIGIYEAKWSDDADGEVDEENNVLLNSKILNKGKNYAMGVIVHELAHRHLKHGYLSRNFKNKNRGGNEFDEMDADLLACDWGFKKEIRIARKNYIKIFKEGFEKLEKNNHLPLKTKYKKKQEKWFNILEEGR